MVQLIAEQQMNANNNGKSRYDNVIRRLVLLRYTETEIVISFRDVYIYIRNLVCHHIIVYILLLPFLPR